MASIVGTMVLSAAACGGAGDAGSKGAFPSRNVEIVVPYPAGGPTDTVARALADALNKGGKLKGHRAQVSNLSGAAGASAAIYLSSARKDGHTFGVFPNSAFTIQSLLKRQPYKMDGFDYLADVARGGLVIVVSKDSPYGTFQEFGEAAKAAPGKLTIGNPGSANLSETEARLVLDAAGYPARVINFEGTAPAMTALLGHNVSAVITALGTVTAQIESGDLKPILFIGKAPEGSVLADVPTLEESGIQMASPLPESPNLVVVPKNLPGDTRATLQQLINEAVSSADYKKVIEAMGMKIPLGTPEENLAMLKAELDWYTTSDNHLCEGGKNADAPLCLAWTKRPGA
jgi:tripartite-type tricarboxylate transporter receptor subunit TctC